MGKCTKFYKDPMKEFENIKGFQKFAVTFIISPFFPKIRIFTKIIDQNAIKCRFTLIVRLF